MAIEPSISTPCPACGSGDTSDDRVYNHHLLLNCTVCGFVFTAERNFLASQYEDVYNNSITYQLMLDDARQTFEGKKGFRDLWWFKRKALNWIHSRLQNGRLLDIGSGPGTLLMVARRNFGYDIQGIEPASAAATVANSYGVQTYCGTVETFALAHADKFDAITCFEVLEHVCDPLSILVTARKLLSKEGLLLLSVPNLDDPYLLLQQIAPTMPPIHINFFSRRSLTTLLNRAGFTLERTFTLPIPSSSVRNIHGSKGFLLRLPYLAAMSLFGKTDGTTLLVMARLSGG
jgi:2-polyprenyl-3-methyl-5-hydroxy-6-metoxy-1,4-benzoquinol methylase